MNFFDSTYKLVAVRSNVGEQLYAQICIAWSPDGRHLAGAWFNGCECPEHGTAVYRSSALTASDGVMGFRGCPGRKTVRDCSARTDSGTVTAMDARSGKPLWQLAGRAMAAIDICISPDGRQYATAVCHDRLYTWDAMQGAPCPGLWSDLSGPRPSCMVQRWPASRSRQGLGVLPATRARIWDPGKPGESHLYHDGGSRCAAWSPDGKTLARGGTDVLLWTSDSEDPHKVFHALMRKWRSWPGAPIIPPWRPDWTTTKW